MAAKLLMKPFMFAALLILSPGLLAPSAFAQGRPPAARPPKPPGPPTTLPPTAPITRPRPSAGMAGMNSGVLAPNRPANVSRTVPVPPMGAVVRPSTDP
jgi:hypothetical protein